MSHYKSAISKAFGCLHNEAVIVTSLPLYSNFLCPWHTVVDAALHISLPGTNTNERMPFFRILSFTAVFRVY
jgi:hypothetical protein